MTHLPFIAGSYALGILIPARLRAVRLSAAGAARRRLAAIDPRARPGAGSRGRPGRRRHASSPGTAAR